MMAVSRSAEVSEVYYVGSPGIALRQIYVAFASYLLRAASRYTPTRRSFLFDRNNSTRPYTTGSPSV